MSQNGVLLPDTREEPDWRALKGSGPLCGWLDVPQIASRQTLGLLSSGHAVPVVSRPSICGWRTSLAIPAVAIQSARLYECAQIYGSELEKRTPYN